MPQLWKYIAAPLNFKKELATWAAFQHFYLRSSAVGRRRSNMLMQRFLCMIWVLGLFFSVPAAAAFSNLPDTTWMTNGDVRVVIRSGDRIYIGGKFTQVRRCPTGTSCKGGVQAVQNVAAFDAATGVAIASFHPMVGDTTAVVYALAVLNGKLFIGGKFTAVDGVSRRNFAAVDIATGILDPNVDALVGAETQFVKALLTVGTRVYVGGTFTTVDGLTRRRLAAFDSNGGLDPNWRPQAGGTVSTLVPDCIGETIFAGGSFERASGTAQPFVARYNVARFDLVNGTLHNWSIPPGALVDNLQANDMAATCDRLFVTYAVANWIYALDLTDDTGNKIWGLHSDGDFQTVAVRNDRLLFGGHFLELYGNGQGTVPRTRFAATNLDGIIDNSWDPAFEWDYYGPRDILVDGDQVWVAGQFHTVSGVAQRGIARFTDNPLPPPPL